MKKIQVIPSVDILNGKVVRLLKGDYKQVTEYEKSPVEVVKSFINQGFNLVHIVNLDGARKVQNEATQEAIDEILLLDCQLQIGGGIRDLQTAMGYISGGASVVLGTICVKNPDLTEEIIKKGENSVVLAFDCKKDGENFKIMANGWQEGTDLTLENALRKFDKHQISLLCTDISVDGTMTAPNFELYTWIKQKFPNFYLQASGGISSIADISKLQGDGIDAVIVGKALHSRAILLEDLVKF